MTYKTFNEFLTEEAKAPSGNYVSIGAELERDGIDVYEGSFTKEPHVTLMYSENTNIPYDKVQEVLAGLTEEIIAKFDAIDIFKSSDGESNAVVLKLDSPELHEIHAKLGSVGLKHSYDDYNPHLTFAYNLSDDSAQKLKTALSEKYENQTFNLKGWTNEELQKDWAKT